MAWQELVAVVVALLERFEDQEGELPFVPPDKPAAMFRNRCQKLGRRSEHRYAQSEAIGRLASLKATAGGAVNYRRLWLFPFLLSMDKPQFSFEKAKKALQSEDRNTPQRYSRDHPFPNHIREAIESGLPWYLRRRVNWQGASVRQLFDYRLNFELAQAQTSNDKKARFFLLAAKSLAIALWLRIQILFCRCPFEVAYQLMQARKWHLGKMEPSFAAMESRLQTNHPVLPATDQPVHSTSRPSG